MTPLLLTLLRSGPHAAGVRVQRAESRPVADRVGPPGDGAEDCELSALLWRRTSDRFQPDHEYVRCSALRQSGCEATDLITWHVD